MTDTLAASAPENTQTDGSTPPFSGYSPHERRPLGSYAALTAIFGASFTGGLFAAYRHRGELPEPGPWDVVTAGVATHKLTRMLTKDRVTAFIRAPFVRFEADAGHGEVEETPRGTGLRYATGELLVCPHCLGQWVAGAVTVGFVGAPRLTRLLTSLYTIKAISDFAQIGYKSAENALDSQ